MEDITTENEECPFCHGKGLLIDDPDNQIFAEIDKEEQYPLPYIYIWTDKSNTSFYIKYCPNCGRKL
jgi:ribosomal protein S27AE